MNRDNTRATGQFGETQTASTTGEGSFDRENAEHGVRLLLEALGADTDKEKLVETWQRRVPATLETLSEGYCADAKRRCEASTRTQMNLSSKPGSPSTASAGTTCFRTLGPSMSPTGPTAMSSACRKLIRYVQWESRRLTMQEQLTGDIADGLADELDVETVLVEMTATRLCEAMRGTETETTTRTSATVGAPADSDVQRFRDSIQSMEESQ